MIDRDALWKEMTDTYYVDGASFADVAGIAMRHITAARAEALEEAVDEAQRIMRLAADSGSTGAVVGAKCVRDAIRALAQSAAPEDKS
jgi:hypothetical protein